MTIRSTILSVGLLVAVGASSGCIRTRSVSSGTLSCSCATAGCSCRHCMGEAQECHCRATDAYGGHTNVGDPDRGEPGTGD